jgi:DNA repair protein RecN (Recombination protein N)
MLTHLTISNIVLIESLSLEMKNGLTALTGETGAGKSILLDSLGLALGQRADSGLLRKGAEQGSVTAAFDLGLNSHETLANLYNDEGILDDNFEGQIILKRQLMSDGRTRAFVNDRPVSVSVLKQIGSLLVDIHGQFETHGLLDSKNHGALLDSFGMLESNVLSVRESYQKWKLAEKKLKQHHVAMEKAREEEEYLTACVEDLEKLNPQKGEEEELLAKRQRLQHQEMIISGLNDAYKLLENDKGANEAVYTSIRALEKIADKADSVIDPYIERLDAALSTLRDIAGDLETTAYNWGEFDENLEHVDDRIHELRGQARKHNCAVDLLSDLLAEMQSSLQNIRNDETILKQLEQGLAQAQSNYNELASVLTKKRVVIAKDLSNSVMLELPDLKLGKAQFRVAVDTASTPSENGLDYVHFLIRTNPGSPEGELGKVASGGELSRIMLALKVVLSNTNPVPVMVFDEVDSGIGGATADAVGARLSRMAKKCQILVVTHSPQVAAKAGHHWIVSKSDIDGKTETTVTPLMDENIRVDEIARMVSGANVTNEARAAAKVLRDVA